MMSAVALTEMRGWAWAVIAGLGGSLLGFAITAAIAHRDGHHEKDE